eukprot:CAMPEP_0198134678 /NCGR_PEP_ID=MMETSP1442-20131203/60199_1 /TAXON_ID= /ORGANISM="Craspedostauros australis, Strain CCMP3328" /LENGTH=466 /DNA_ID=CAMNT_0043795825 /DNA_START=307 /DNA_END=1704 /DNA_ORIENTATION=+
MKRSFGLCGDGGAGSTEAFADDGGNATSSGIIYDINIGTTATMNGHNKQPYEYSQSSKMQSLNANGNDSWGNIEVGGISMHEHRYPQQQPLDQQRTLHCMELGSPQMGQSGQNSGIHRTTNQAANQQQRRPDDLFARHAHTLLAMKSNRSGSDVMKFRSSPTNTSTTTTTESVSTLQSTSQSPSRTASSSLTDESKSDHAYEYRPSATDDLESNMRDPSSAQSDATSTIANRSSRDPLHIANMNEQHGRTITNMDRTVVFRTILPKDRVRVQHLHEEWFPVEYQSDFYDELVHQRMTRTGDPLFTSIAANTESDQMVACVVASMVSTKRLNHASRKLLLANSDCFSRAFYIMTLGTEAEYRKMGLATMLIRQCIDKVRGDPRCGALYLHVLIENTSAIRFYERLGFWRVKLIHDYYTINGEKRHCYLYARYFHGNTGHLTAYIVISAYLHALWKRIKSPLTYWTNW